MKVIGSAFVEFFPSKTHEDIERVRSFRKGIGGSGANIAIAEARMGARPQLISAVGDDPLGRFIKSTLVSEGVDCSHVRCERGYLTGISFYELDREGRSNYYFYRFPGVSMPEERLGLEDVDFGEDEIVTVTEAALRGTELRLPEGVRIFYEPNIRKVFWNEQLKKRTKAVIDKAYAVFPNREELSLITESDDIERGAEMLLKHAELVVVKLGRYGARAFSRSGSFTAAGIDVKVRSDIGAGDTFHGVFVSLLSEGKSIGEVLETANRAAAFRVATGRFPKRKDL
jgi:5-dehydro-2-deoxygluconokinase